MNSTIILITKKTSQAVDNKQKSHHALYLTHEYRYAAFKYQTIRSSYRG